MNSLKLVVMPPGFSPPPPPFSGICGPSSFEDTAVSLALSFHSVQQHRSPLGLELALLISKIFVVVCFAVYCLLKCKCRHDQRACIN